MTQSSIPENDPFGAVARARFRSALADQGVMDVVEEALEGQGVAGDAPDVLAAWAALRERMVRAFAENASGRGQGRIGGEGRTLLGGGFKAQPLRRWAWPIMTAITFVAGGVIAVWSAGKRHLSHNEPTSVLTYATANGQRANITLPDGSTVVLNVASRLDVPVDYATGHHTVRLVGEALFTVTRHDGIPFLVNAGSATAQVLGTSFLVRHYPTDTVATVAVLDGKVSVHSVVLTAVRQAVVGQKGTIHVGPADLASATFTKRVLTFDGVPLREAIGMLDRWFDADIRLQDATVGAQKVTGGFPSGSLSELTESLESAFDVRVVREGRVLTVYPK